jgi:hypothetical protein
MKALKSHPQIERPRRINSQITLAKYTAGLVLALVGLISAALMKGQGPPEPQTWDERRVHAKRTQANKEGPAH